MNKLSFKQSKLLSNILVSISMTVVMTGGMLFVHSGYCNNFFKLWFKDFLVGCFISIQTGLIVVPFITKWVDKFSKDNNIN